MPFLIESKFKELGAKFQAGADFDGINVDQPLPPPAQGPVDDVEMMTPRTAAAQRL